MAVPPIVHAEHRVVRGLRGAGATSPDAAMPVSAGRRIDARALERLLDAGVVRDQGGGSYYLDVEAYRAYRAARLKRVFTLLAVVAFVVLVLALSGTLR